MVRRSIRFRLTIWYLAVFSLGMVSLNLATWFALRQALMENRENALDRRLAGLARFLEEEALGNDLPAIQEEAREYSSGMPEGQQLRVWDANGNLLFEHRGAGTELLERRGEYTVRGNPVILELGAPLDDYYGTLATLSRVMIGLLPVVLAIASAGGWWLARRALAPVDEMTREAQSISARDLAARVSAPATGDELQRLAVAWNGLLSRIESTVRSVIQFTADAAHELRTPVAVVRTSAELALRQERSAESYRSTLRSIQDETARMTDLLDQLLLLARGDSGKLQFRFDAVPAGTIVRDAVGAAASIAAVKQIRLEQELPDEDALVWADEEALRRLVLILLDNAFKFTPPSGRVSVRVARAAGHCAIEVEDTGCGVAPEILPHIFDRFYRGDPARTPGSGAGLGLAIARTIMDAHGGGIEVTSREGKGSVFRAVLPTVASLEPAASRGV